MKMVWILAQKGTIDMTGPLTGKRQLQILEFLKHNISFTFKRYEIKTIAACLEQHKKVTIKKSFNNRIWTIKLVGEDRDYGSEQINPTRKTIELIQRLEM